MSPVLRTIRLAPLVLSLTLAGCSKDGSDTAAQATTTSTTGTSGASAPMAPGPAPVATTLAHGITEEEFKAMHEPVSPAPAPPKGQMIDLPGTSSKAYLSLPEGATAPMPGVTVIHEWWGLNDNIKHWADRLAAEGYAALAVDLYGGKVATTPDEAMAAMKGVKQEEATAILLAAHRFLATDPRIMATKRASIGWCFGGGQSLQLALAAPDLDGAVIYYGFLDPDPDHLKNIKASILGVFANKDQNITPADVTAFDEALTKVGVKHEIHRYDADHAFANPSGSRYDQPAATDAWAQARAFLAKTLK
jgi:carboxymethylenebutenolidase